MLSKCYTTELLLPPPPQTTVFNEGTVSPDHQLFSQSVSPGVKPCSLMSERQDSSFHKFTSTNSGSATGSWTHSRRGGIG